MKTLTQTPLGEIMATRAGTVDPTLYPNETFDLYSIPAFDKGEPDVLLGQEIGSTKQVVQPGDVLLSKIVPHIRRSWVVGKARGRRLIASSEWIVFRSDRFHSPYLRHVLTSDPFHVQFMGTVAGVGGSLLRARPAQVASLSIPLPPLPEQRRIADILDKADAIRRKRQEAGRLAGKIREATFIDLFGDPRWPVQPWTEVSLAEVTDIDAPMVDPREDQYQNLIHIGPDRIEKETGRLLPAMTAAEERLISGKFLFDDRYLLYSKIRPYLRKVAMPDFTGLCSADVYPVRPKPEMATREFLFSLLISEAFLAYTQSLASRASIPKLNREEFGKYRFPLPPLALQEKYTHIVKTQVVCNKRLSSAAEKCEDLFHSLVQRAFRGEL